MPLDLVEYRSNDPKPKFGLVRDGVAGNVDVVLRMVDIVKNEVILDKGFEDFVKQTTAAAGLDSFSDPKDIFEFWYNYLKNGNDNFDGVAYIADVQGNIESIKSARRTIEDGYGDCDDQAILIATILAVLGYSPCFVIARYPDSETFSHVYTVNYENGKRYVFDLTIPNGKLNDEIKNAVTDEFCIFDNTSLINGAEAALRNIKYLGLETQSNIKKSIPLLAGLLPLGFIGHSLANAALFSGIEDKRLSFNSYASDVSGRLTDIIIKLQNGLLTRDQALTLARKEFSTLYTYPETNISVTDKKNPAVQTILSRLQKRIDYIENYGAVEVSTDLITSNSSLIKYVLLGGAVLFLLSKTKI